MRNRKFVHEGHKFFGKYHIISDQMRFYKLKILNLVLSNATRKIYKYKNFNVDSNIKIQHTDEQ